MIRADLSKQRLSFKMTMLSLLVTGLLAGCGIQGGLKTPPPVFGSDKKVDEQRVPTKDLDKDEDDDAEDEYGVLSDDFLVDP